MMTTRLSSPVAVLSYRCGAAVGNDKQIVGKQINLNTVGHSRWRQRAWVRGHDAGRVVAGRNHPDCVGEPQLNVEDANVRAGVWWLRLMGRLKPGATRSSAPPTENVFQQSVVSTFGSQAQTQGNAAGRF